MVEEQVRRVAWAIAEAWWRKQHRQAGGAVPEADSSTDYADRFWQGWVEEAAAALNATAETPVQPERGGGGLR